MTSRRSPPRRSRSSPRERTRVSGSRRSPRDGERGRGTGQPGGPGGGARGPLKRTWIGCSGWSYADWRGRFYASGLPQRRWLEHYSSIFDTVEVNATFYRLQPASTVAAWAEATPDGFLFSVKASRYLTHVRRLRGIEQGIERFYDQLAPLEEAGKLGPVLWQLPANFHRDDEVLEEALGKLPPGRHCFEFRHRSWFAAPVYALLRRQGAAAVVADDARRPLPFPKATADLIYARLHFGSRGRNGNYSAAELERWRRRIAAWRARREVFAYLNNDWMAYAPRNARALL